ncbi:sortase A [Evansella vedderi]|uniref:Sortase A n=1 Tax=Evansella vedderi TaxID=38282 RepID=A0ABT9ZWR5_9BACI|nr:class D sortase [Evansella vedderi]MDQ0255666.1 sortase A [Evansella vedderi]
MNKWSNLIRKIATGITVLGSILFIYAIFNYAPIFFVNNETYEYVSNDFLERETIRAAENIVETDLNISETNNINLEDVLLYPKRPEIGEEIGILDIPVINAKLPIFHGTDEDELDRGVGHYRGSVLPGEPDHSILSGHRDTVFRELKDVNINDELIVTTTAGQFTYVVVDIYIVDAEDTSVIRPTGKPTLSLTTCYPFTFIGNAPERYILEADLVDFQLNQ